MAISAYLTFEKVNKLFLLQLVFNTAWSWLFFAFQLPLLALIDIYLLIAVNIYIYFLMKKDSRLASYLYLPYIIWLIFASHLNLIIVLYN